ncbi:MAG: hypothetical protein HRT45_14800 [Bdellovibrionales bacterium]|nr:hypothetical protein [Bdellovibrionales bacterium]
MRFLQILLVLLLAGITTAEAHEIEGIDSGIYKNEGSGLIGSAKIERVGEHNLLLAKSCVRYGGHCYKLDPAMLSWNEELGAYTARDMRLTFTMRSSGDCIATQNKIQVYPSGNRQFYVRMKIMTSAAHKQNGKCVWKDYGWFTQEAPMTWDSFGN